MQDYEILDMYDAVNRTTSLEELYGVLESFKGLPQLGDYNIDTMLDAINYLMQGDLDYIQYITRRFGIRQQAMMLQHYGKIN